MISSSRSKSYPNGSRARRVRPIGWHEPLAGEILRAELRILPKLLVHFAPEPARLNHGGLDPAVRPVLQEVRWLAPILAERVVAEPYLAPAAQVIEHIGLVTELALLQHPGFELLGRPRHPFSGRSAAHQLEQFRGGHRSPPNRKG